MFALKCFLDDLSVLSLCYFLVLEKSSISFIFEPFDICLSQVFFQVLCLSFYKFLLANHPDKVWFRLSEVFFLIFSLCMPQWIFLCVTLLSTCQKRGNSIYHKQFQHLLFPWEHFWKKTYIWNSAPLDPSPPGKTRLFIIRYWGFWSENSV